MVRKIIALHGFLGLTTDWEELNIPQLKAIDLYQLEWASLQHAAKQLNNQCAHEEEKPILVGYSLGGRLALHALIDRSDLWHAGVIISAHPGLVCEKERERRLQSDRQWAKRFLEEKWEIVMEAWNGRETFMTSSFKFNRKENDYDKKTLAQILDKGSLGRQEDLRKTIANLPLPIIWMAGERDLNYARLLESIALKNSQSRIERVSQAGHRLPWEQPQLLKSLLECMA